MPGPLAGIRILEFPAIGPVPFLGMLFADLGAEVIRIDRLSKQSDPFSELPVGPTGALGRGRRSLGLDLRHPDSADIALDLIDSCEVLIEGFRPGVAERLGVGPETALARNPKLVYGRMTGWGQDGPLAPRAGHDITYLAVSGLLHGVGPSAGPPTPPANYVADFGGGAMSMAVGVLAAVLSARQTGIGQVVDVAMLDAATYLATMVRILHGHGSWTDQRAANIFDGGAPNYRCYETADGRYLAVGALEPKFWNVLIETLGLDPAATPPPFDPARKDELTCLLADVFRTKTRDAWTEIFAPLDACVAPVLTLAEAPEHAHNKSRASYVEVSGVQVGAVPMRFAETPATVGTIGRIAADTQAILAELNYSDERVSDLRRRGVIN